MTAVTEILTHCKKLISEDHQIDTQGLVHWIEDTLLEMEKQQIIDAYHEGQLSVLQIIEESLIPMGFDSTSDKEDKEDAIEYYNETFKSE